MGHAFESDREEPEGFFLSLAIWLGAIALLIVGIPCYIFSELFRMGRGQAEL